MFYESEHSRSGEQLKVMTGVNFSFPSHLHGNFELITVLEGEMTVSIDKKQYRLTPGRAVLVFPNQIHELYTETASRHLLCIFSPQLVHAYSNTYLNRVPICADFAPEPFYLRQLERLKEQPGVLQAKSCLYGLCADFDAGTEYMSRDHEREDLLQRIFHFVEEHYTADCTLQALSEYTSYHKVYLSRYFKHCTGLGFTDHVNRCRINEASYLLKNSDRKMLEIAYGCGFDSLRSFNRNFRLVMGMSPSTYREKTG